MDATDYNNFDISNNSETNLIDNIHDYEDFSIQSETKKTIKYLIKIIFIVIGLILISLLLSISDKLKNFNPILGYISLIIFVILFIIYFLRPIFKIFKMDYFITDVNKSNSNYIKKHNNNVRYNIAQKIINFDSNINNSGWYDKLYVEKLKNALESHDNKKIKDILTILMNDSIKKASDRIIVNNSVQAGVYAAISQSPMIDALLVFSVNFKMIKDLIFLYGFRPTETKLLKISIHVLINTFAAYKLDAAQIGVLITSRFTSKSIPIFSNGTAYLTDAVIQALTNGTLTMWAGYKTLSYIMKEYNLQALFDDIDILDDSNEFGNTRSQIIEEIKNKIPFIKNSFEKFYNDNNIDSESTTKIDNNSNSDSIVMPFSSNFLVGKSFIDVQKQLLNLGFDIDNINLKSRYEKSKNIFKKDGKTIDISINGVNKFTENTLFTKDSKVEITYITYI